MNKIKFIILSIFIFTNLFAGTDGTIRGQVVDADGAPLIGAQIYIESIGIGTTADIDGNYILINISVGDYEVKCQMIGYQTNIVSGVNVTMDQTTWLNFSLTIAAIEGDVVRVSSQKRLVEKGTTSKKLLLIRKQLKLYPLKMSLNYTIFNQVLLKLKVKLQEYLITLKEVWKKFMLEVVVLVR